MSLKEAWAFAVAVVALSTACHAWRAPSTAGREFIFALPSDYVYKRSSTQRLFLASQTGREVTATIVASGSKFNDRVTVPADREVVVDLPRSLTSRGTGLKQNAVGVRADGDISVHVQMEAGVNSGAFTPIPTKSLGTDYIVGIYEPLRPRYRAGFTVTATQSGALLNIVFSNPVQFGNVYFGKERVFTFHLEPYESFQVMSDKDLTGTRITSHQPVAVVAGSECSRVPRGVKYCDYLVEQLPPVYTLGKDFIVAPFRSRRSSYVVRMVAPFNDTTVEFLSEIREPVHLRDGQFHEVVYRRRKELAFRSTAPLLVLQYMKGYRSGDYVGDPSMVVVPPVEQYNAGSMSLVSMASDHVTIVVTGTSAVVSGLRVNGETISLESGDWSVMSADATAGVLHGTLSSGRHTISHTDPRARFMVVGYGNGYISSRAYPVAYNLRRLYVPSETPLSIPPRGYRVTCLNTSMIVTLDTSVFLIGHPSDVTLNDRSCQPDIDQDVNDGIVVLQTDFDTCGTTVQEDERRVTFSNTLWFSHSVITPVSPLLDLPFKCVIEQQSNASTSIRVESPALTAAILDDLTVSLVEFMDDTFSVRRRQPGDIGIGNGTSPSESTPGADGTEMWGELVEGTRNASGSNYFAVNVTSSIATGVFVDTCWTTPGPEQTNPNSREIVQNGCGVDDTIRLGASVDDPRFRPIAVDSFSPIGEYHEVFMHCRVQVCSGPEGATDCRQECPPGSRRRRDTERVKAREIRIVSTGPIRTT